MPKTNAENARDIADIKTWMNEKDKRDSKVDTLLETLTEQSKRMGDALDLFREALSELKQQMSTMRLLITGGCFVATAIISGLIGHFLNLLH